MVSPTCQSTDDRLAFYIHRKNNRPPNWSDTNTDVELPLLIMVLVIVGIILTGILVAYYWQSQGWAWEKTNQLWDGGWPSCVLAPFIVAFWLGGLVLCGAPPIVLVTTALCA